MSVTSVNNYSGYYFGSSAAQNCHKSENTGKISQNYDVIDIVNRKFSENADISGFSQMSEMSPEEVSAAYLNAKNRANTLYVDDNEFIDNIYSNTGDNITYNINGVTFTNAEMKSCKEIMRQAVSALPLKGSDLSYGDYAAMGIAENLISEYAKANLTDSQAEILNSSIEKYFNSLIAAEKESQSAEGGLNETAVQSLKIQISNLPEYTKNNLTANLKYAQSGAVRAQSAKSSEAALSIRNMFKNADLKDKLAVKRLFEQYSEIMQPVYREYGLRNSSESNSLTNALQRDIDRFTRQIENF